VQVQAQFDHFRLGFRRAGLSLRILSVHVADSVAAGAAACRLMASLGVGMKARFLLVLARPFRLKVPLAL
jgi:hypothetical protein